MKLIFATTCQNIVYIEKLYKSIIEGNKTLDLCVITLLQKGIKIEEELYENDFTKFIFLHTDNSYGLSKARNIIIDHIMEQNMKFDYIMFPDDDSTFDSSFFDNFCNFVFCDSLISVYNQNTKIPYKLDYKHFSHADVNSFELAMSVNMIFSYKTFINIRHFDENMGVGAKYGAGEDADYFIRCCNENNRGFNVVHELYNFHPANTQKNKLMTLKALIKRYRTYGEGAIYLCIKHKLHGKAIKYIMQGICGAMHALVFFNVKLFVARVFGIYYRFITLLKLL